MLTDAQCRNATCPADKKQARFADSGGMYLQVSPAGSKRWFYKYRTADVEKQLALGSYPAVTLAAARKARDVASRVLTTAGQVWRYAVATARASRDITPDLRGALKPHRGKHFAAITEPGQLGGLLRVIRG